MFAKLLHQHHPKYPEPPQLVGKHMTIVIFIVQEKTLKFGFEEKGLINEVIFGKILNWICIQEE